MIAAIYSRKSKFTGKGDSVENQVQLCKAHSRALGITDFKIYEDEGFSGGNTNRPQFQKMLKDAKAKKFDVLICYRLDRISRNIADFTALIEKLQDYGIGFVSIREQFDTSTPMGRAMMYIASVFAQLERETIAERVKDNMLELAKAGRWLGGTPPLGFDSNSITYFDGEMKERKMTKLIPNKTEMKIVKLIFQKYIELGSISQVVIHLYGTGYKGKRNKDFSASALSKILRNPVYVKSNEFVLEYLENKKIPTCGTPNENGILIYNKRDAKFNKRKKEQWIAAIGNHKGIIEPEIWLRVQERLDKNCEKYKNIRLGTSRKALLTGLLRCSHCGSPMRVSYGKSNYYYVCTKKVNSKSKACNNKNAKGPDIETIVVENIKRINKDQFIKELTNNKKDTGNQGSKMKNIEDEIETKNKQMNNLIVQLASFDDPDASTLISDKIKVLSKDTKKLKAKLEHTETEKIEINENNYNIDIVINALKEFNSHFDSTDNIHQKRFMLETIIDKIYWDGLKNEIRIDFWGKNNSTDNTYPCISKLSKLSQNVQSGLSCI